MPSSLELEGIIALGCILLILVLGWYFNPLEEILKKATGPLRNLVSYASSKQKLLLIYLPLVLLCVLRVPVSAVRESEGSKLIYYMGYQFLWEIPAWCTRYGSEFTCGSIKQSYGVWKTTIDLETVILEIVALTAITALISVLLDLVEKKSGSG